MYVTNSFRLLDFSFGFGQAFCWAFHFFSFWEYLNEKNYKINNSVGNIIPHDFQKVIPNLGLKRDGHQGNLIIHFKVQFPTQLSIDKVKKLEEILD